MRFFRHDRDEFAVGPVDVPQVFQAAQLAVRDVEEVLLAEEFPEFFPIDDVGRVVRPVSVEQHKARWHVSVGGHVQAEHDLHAVRPMVLF